MKKMLKTGKKALSVIMAVLMVMTAWVWVVPTEAEAATAGNYKVRITWQVNNTKNYNNSFTGTETEDGARAGIILYYKSNNGSGTQSSMYWCLDSTNYGGTYVSAEKSTGNTNSSTGKDYYCVATIAGFPTALYGMADSDYFGDKGQYTVSKIEVYNNTKSAYDTLWAGKGYTDTSTEKKWWKITADGDGTVTTTGNDNDYGYASTTTETWNFPTPTTATTWSGVSAMTIPKTGTATQDIELVANDQYGVEMFNPTWSVKGSVCGTTGISVDPTTSSQTTTIKLTNAANVSSSTDTQTGTITATWSTLGSLSETFTITDSYYTATFNYKSSAGADTSTKKYGYHGDTITAPTAPEYDSGDNHYKFSKWSPTFASTITKDVTYTAQYTSTFVGADYSAVNEAIAAADAIKANYGTEYELKYTHASRLALDSAINAVVTGLGRTKQDVVDGYAQAINDAIAALDPNKFDVIFLDKDGAILLYEKDVEYKESVTAPSYNDKYYDSTNHYTFIGWDTDEYASVVDDLVIQPVFTAEAHTFTTETVPSTCVQKGATKYICSCGYSYIDGETDYGDHVWETEFTTDLEPTCTVAGSKSIHCTLCDAQKDITVIDPLGHQWSSQSIAVEASCGKIGIMTKVCDDCGVCEHTIIPALEHDYKETVVAPTCTTKGYTEYTCQRADCGHSYRDNYTDIVAHTYGAWETVSEAHCGVEGVKKQTCTECGHVNIGSIDALQHNLSGWTDVVEQTCTGKGYQVKTCSICKNVIEEQWLNALGHNYVEKTVVTPTCTSKGYTIEECNREDCGAQRIVDEKAALNHAWTSTTHEADCTHGTYIEHVCANDASHNYVEYVTGSPVALHTWTKTDEKAADCENDGYIDYKCSVCDEATKREILSKLGHSYGNWEVVKAATNTEDGQWKRVCDNNAEHIEYLTIPKGGHTWDNGTVTEAATCSKAGKMVYKCTAHENCDVTLEVTVPVTQHTVAQKVTAATCTEKGKVEAYCPVCDAECAKPFNTTETPVVPHTLDNGTEVAATCTTSGYTLYRCTVDGCDFSYKEYNENEKVKDHEYKAEETLAPTCTTEGTMTYTCACGASYTAPISPTGHSFVEDQVAATDATCTALATKTYECSCGESYTEHYGTLAAHKFDTLVKTVPATNDSLGYEERECACGLTQITILEATGTHVFNEKIESECVAPTCTENGTDVYKCTAHTNCTAKSSVLVPRLGHTVTAVYNAPTCIAQGSSEAYCTNCKTTVSSTVIPATGIHDFSGVGVKVDATCTNTGTMTYTCQTDGCTETKTETILAKGHDLTTTVTDATCTGKGSVEITCSRCDDPIVEKTYELAAKNHSWNNGEETNAPTCTDTGLKTYTCTACGGTKTETIPATDHSYKGEETTAATCTAEGVKNYTCSKCGDSYTETLPKLQHVYAEESTIAPTCTASGYKTYKCNNCTSSYVVITEAAKGHSLVEGTSTANCTTGGEMTLECDACEYSTTVDVPALGHNYQKISTTAATCAAAATETYKCSRCDAQYTISVGEKAKEHSYSDNWTTVQEATPTSIGYRTRTCSVCGQLDVDTIEATGEHKFETGEIVNTVPATCTENGYETRKCSVHTGENDCGKTANITIPATGHTEEAIAAVAATCEKEGSSAGSKCSVCGTVIVAPVELPKLGHEWGNEKVTPATCKAEGKIEYTCTRGCGATETRVIEIVENAHNLETTVEQATCTADGSVITKCTLCGDATTETIPAKGHTFTGTETPVKDASCTENGEKTVKCANCDEVNTVIIPKLGHKMKAGEKVDPTCTTSGYTPYTCENGCDESYRVYDETVKEHNYVQVEGSSTATCIAGGTVTMKCSHCADEITAEVPALGHSYGEWTTVNPTAEVEGSKTRECGRCHVTETVILLKLGHDMVKDEAASTAATCTEKGTDVYVCTTHTGDAACGYTYKVELPAKGHSYGEGVVTKSATCTENGVKTFTCACGDEYTQVIPMTGHRLSTTVTEATCEDAGSVVTECTNSGCDHKDEKVLAKLPHTISVSYAYPGCDKGGYVKEKCDKCDYENTISTAPALGHSYTGEETVVKEASCLEKGEKTVKCSRCDATVTVEIPAKGHSYVAGAEVPATCTESGYIPYECACGSSYKELTSNPNGHKWNTQPEAGSVIATCVVDGKVTYKCQFCDAKNEVITPKFGHSWSAWKVVVNPTATVDGVQMRKCLRDCGATESVIIPALGGTTTYTVSFVVDGKTVATQTVNHGSAATAPEISNKAPDAKYHYSFIWDTDFTKVTSDLTVTAVFTPAAHDFGEWVIDLEANCNRDGARHRVCSCGYTESEVIPATEHDFSEIKEEKAATCTENGYKVVVCKNCGATERQTIKRLGHLMNYFEGVEATCDRDGVAGHYSCSRCGKSFEDRAGKVELTDTVIKKRYHTYVVVEGSDPTCTKEGVTDYRYCTACGYTQHPEKIPATGHADVNNDNTCDKCGATYMQGGEVVCSCRCHKNGFFNELIYKILSFFWRLFGTNKSCECGKVHY